MDNTQARFTIRRTGQYGLFLQVKQNVAVVLSKLN